MLPASSVGGGCRAGRCSGSSCPIDGLTGGADRPLVGAGRGDGSLLCKAEGDGAAGWSRGRPLSGACGRPRWRLGGDETGLNQPARFVARRRSGRAARCHGVAPGGPLR